MTELLLALLDLFKSGFEWLVDAIWDIVLGVVSWAFTAGQTFVEMVLGDADWLPDLELGDWFYDTANWVNEWVPLDIALTMFIALLAFDALLLAMRMARRFILLGG